MATTTKKMLTNRIAERLNLRQMLVREIIQSFLDECIAELAQGNRLEFRDFGVFETVARAARKARNPKTGQVVVVPPKTVVDFKMGKRMRIRVNLHNADEGEAQPEEAEPLAQHAPAPAAPPSTEAPPPPASE